MIRSTDSRRDGRGQALVELALILPILLMLLLGIFEFGRAWNTKQVITDAAREGARLAVVQNNDIDQDDVKAADRHAPESSGDPGHRGHDRLRRERRRRPAIGASPTRCKRSMLASSTILDSSDHS